MVVTFATVEVPNHWKTLDVADEIDSLSTGNELVVSAGLTPLDSLIDSEYGTQIGGDEEHLGQSASIDDAIEAAVAEGPAAVLLDERDEARWLFVRVAPAVAVVYFVGACLFLLRLMVATWGGHRLRIASQPIGDPNLRKLVVDQSRRVGLRLIPTVRYCERVAVPMAVGVLRPVVLLPASIMTGLDPEQFAAIISHELAHIRRHDLLMNLIQRLIESLLFFHPVVWYISRRMSAERESCCDELVVSSGFSAMDYAGALLQMAELCSAARQSGVVAAAASGRNVSQFEVRIQRLMNRTSEARLRLTRAGVLMIALLIGSVAATPAVFRNWAHAQSDAERTEGDRQFRNNASVPEKEKTPGTVESSAFHWPDRLSGDVKGVEGTGIAGAEVELTITEHFREGTDLAKQALKTVRTKADDNGKYTFHAADWPVPSAERPFSINVVASAPEHAPWETRFFNCAGDRKVSDSLPELKLPRGREITGRCTDAKGEPVVGAAIRGQSALDQPGRWQVSHRPTDRDGRFRVMVPEGHAAALWIVSESAGNEQVEIPATHDGPLQVRMHGGTSIVGQVESLSGEPVAGTLVVLRSKESVASFQTSMILRFATLTDEQGRFRLPPAHGEFKCYLAQASMSNERFTDESVFAHRAAPPVVPVAVSLDGTSRQKEVRLRECRTVQLGGVVRLEDGRAVEGCPIDVYCYNVKIGKLVSDEDGRYSVTVPATPHEFIISGVNATNHRVRAAQDSPGKHESQFIILNGVTEDMTNVDFVYVSRSNDVEQPVEHSGSVLFWEELVRLDKKKEQPARLRREMNRQRMVEHGLEVVLSIEGDPEAANRIKPGLTADVRIHALPDDLFPGQISSISDVPVPGTHPNSNLKKYEAVITIKSHSELVNRLRPRMTVDVRVHALPEEEFRGQIISISDAPPPGGRQNAALHYWRAFALLPKLDEKQKDAIPLALKQRTVDESLQQVIELSNSALYELGKGAALEYCFWGFSPEEGPSVTMPHLARALQISQIACLRAKASFEQDQVTDAIEDIDTVITLGKHVDQDNRVISLLVSYIIEQTAIETVASELPLLDKDQLEALAQRIDGMSPKRPMSEAVLAERDLFTAWLLRIHSKLDEKERPVTSRDGVDSETAKAFRRLSQKELLDAAQEMEEFYHRVAEAVALPPAEAKRAEERLKADPAVEGPGREMAMAMISVIGAARMDEAKYETLLALLKAAIAVQQDGPEVLKKDAYRDPFGTGSFEYRETADGFELQSGLVDRSEQPVSLTIGRP